jgi:PAS domain S-box-containing protein
MYQNMDTKMYFYQLDLRAGATIVSVDQELADFLGCAGKLNSASSWYDFIHPDDQEEIQQLHAGLVVGSKYLDVEYQIRTSDGRYVTVKDQGGLQMNAEGLSSTLLGTIRVVEELTPEASNLRTGRLINLAQKDGKIGAYYFTPRDQKIYWSTELKTIHGLEVEPSIDDYWELIYTEDREKHLGMFNKMIQEGVGYKSVYRIVKRSDGSVNYVFTTVDPVFSDGGEIIAVSGTTVDINDVMQLLQERTDLLNEVLPKEERKQQPDILFFRHDGRLQPIQVNSIVAVSALKDYVQIITDKQAKPYVVYKTLKEALTLLPDDKFIQIHRSHIINISRIEQVDGQKVSIAGVEYPVSKSFKPNLMSALEKGL